MIARDEAARIACSFALVADIFDDIVLVDTGSTDETRAIARRHGARVFNFAWCDDFAAARNESLRHARGDWIFWLDADDHLDAPNVEKLRTLLASVRDENVAYLMTCRSMMAPTKVASEVQHARLFRNDPRIRWEHRVHEQILPSVLRCGGTAVSTDITILHGGYQDAATLQQKLERNLRLAELECAERPLDGFVLYCRGSILLSLRRSSEALVSLLLSRGLLPPEADAARDLHLLITRAFLMERDLPDALQAARYGLTRFPRDSELLMTEAELLTELDELPAAEASLVRLLDSGESPMLSHDERTLLLLRARYLLSFVEVAIGRYAAGEADARAALDASPSFREPWLVLADALVGQGRGVELGPLVAEAEGAEGMEPVIRVLQFLDSMSRGKRADADAHLESALEAFPQDPLLLGARRAARNRYVRGLDILQEAHSPDEAHPIFGPWHAALD